MRILILSWKDPLHPSAGGAERYAMAVARRWASEAHQVTILGPRRNRLQDQAWGDADHEIGYLGVGSRLTVFREARRFLRSHRGTFDRVLETVSTRPFAAHRVVGDQAVAVYYQTAEEVWRMEFPFPMSWVGRHLLEPRWIGQMKQARVVAISPSTASALGRYGVDTEAVVPPGCDPRLISGPRLVPSGNPRLIWMGRLVRTKRPGDAVAAFQRVRAAIPGATLDLVGGGYLEREMRAKKFAGVTVHGFINEAAKASLLSRADLLLLPGTREGWGIVALEAAAYGVPAVAYDIPGLRDAVLDGVTGVLVPAEESALASASIRLLLDPDRWARCSESAQQRAREFTWDRTAGELLACLRRPTEVKAAGVAHPGWWSEVAGARGSMPEQREPRWR